MAIKRTGPASRSRRAPKDVGTGARKKAAAVRTPRFGRGELWISPDLMRILKGPGSEVPQPFSYLSQLGEKALTALTSPGQDPERSSAKPQHQRRRARKVEPPRPTEAAASAITPPLAPPPAAALPSPNRIISAAKRPRLKVPKPPKVSPPQRPKVLPAKPPKPVPPPKPPRAPALAKPPSAIPAVKPPKRPR